MFRRVAEFLNVQLVEATIDAPGPTQNLLGRLSVLAVRQAEALVALFVAGPYYSLQIGQLVRGLLEMWRVAAWLTQPDRLLPRNQRAIGLWVASLAEERETMEVQQGLSGMEPSLEKLAELQRQERLVAEAAAQLLGEARPRQPGGARNDYKALGRQDRYVLFRRESEMAHVGAIALGQMVENQAEDHVRLGGRSPVDDRARKLGVAWDTMADIAEIVVTELDLDQEAWQKLRDRGQDDLAQLIGPIIGIEPDPG